ncbi:MAG: hypothetical protein C0621_04970 [Desulfuromonas sp.]|nr:MAG: hypothetical protein C0621_04970 [Desulfuromonas sp.]
MQTVDTSRVGHLGENINTVKFLSIDANGNTIKKTEGTGSGTVPVPLDPETGTGTATAEPVPTLYHYDARNRLTEVELPDGRIVRYAYDPFGRRVRKTITGTGSQGVPVPLVTLYDYADEGFIGEYASDGTTQKTYGWKPDGLWGTDPLYMRDGGNIYYYHNDHLGTPQLLTDKDKNIVWSMVAQAFGETYVAGGAMVENNLRFPGQYFDAETGLHYNFQRYYDPTSGRYTQVDPIGFAGGDVNLYRYVGNGVLVWIDPWGLWRVSGSVSSIGIDINKSIFNSEKEGVFENENFEITASTTVFGVGLNLEVNANNEMCKYFFDDSDSSISVGIPYIPIASDYLGLGYSPGKDTVSINFGSGIGLPISYSSSIENTTKSIALGLEVVTVKIAEKLESGTRYVVDKLGISK